LGVHMKVNQALPFTVRVIGASTIISEVTVTL
jgi:hypothetical protein